MGVDQSARTPKILSEETITGLEGYHCSSSIASDMAT